MNNNLRFVIILLLALIMGITSIFFLVEFDLYSFLGNKQANVSKGTNFNHRFKYYIDKIDIDEKYINIRGWTVVIGENSVNYHIKIALQTKDDYLIYNTNNENRSDVTAHFNDGFNYDNSGFKVQIDKTNLNRAEYALKIILNNKDNKYQDIIKILNINNHEQLK